MIDRDFEKSMFKVDMLVLLFPGSTWELLLESDWTKEHPCWIVEAAAWDRNSGMRQKWRHETCKQNHQLIGAESSAQNYEQDWEMI